MNQLEQAVKILKRGGVVVYPTDTAYGLAVDATNVVAVRGLYALKGRNFRNPIHVIVPAGHHHTFVYDGKPAKRLMQKFWPGPLTLVLPLRAKGPSWQMLSAGTKTLGIRYPDYPMAQALVEALNKPITTTSANLAGKNNCYSVAEVKKQFSKSKFKPDFYLDGGELPKTKPSTVVAIDKNRVKILRAGPINERQIKSVFS